MKEAIGLGAAISRSRLLLGTSFLSLSILIGAPAAAQEAAVETTANADVAQDDSGTAVEDIVVTAQRRDERLQDVPIAVTALSETALQNLQASDVGDLEGSVPNLTIHEGDASNAVVYVRGVGQVDSLAFADPGVGIYIDDVYLGRAQGAFLSVYDVDRIEVLRGPQGTLYGRNTIGGAVKFVSSPLSNELNYRAEATYGSYDELELKGSVGGALVDDVLLAKAAISYSRRDGYSDNAFDGSDDGDKNQLAGRLALEFRPSSDVRFRLNVDASRDRPDHSRTPARATSVFGLYPATLDDPFEVDANFNGLSDLDTFGVSLTGEWDVSDALTLKSISAYREMDYATELDLDATPLAIFGTYVDEQQHQYSQEFQLNYSGDRFNAVAGIYYFDEKDVTISGIFGPVIEFISASLNDQHNRSVAVYGQGSYELTDKLSLTGGLRYTYEKKDFFRTQEFFAATAPYPVPYGTGAEVTRIDTDNNWDALTPKIGIDYKASDDVLAYASVSRGFKSGGFDGRANNEDGAVPYNPETLWAYEVGVKSTLLDRKLIANLALFWNDYKDLQLSSFTADENGGFTALFTNAGAATIRGAELELQARPVPALNLNMTLGYLDAHYDEYIGPGGVDISDERELVNAPKWSARFGATYVFDLGNNGDLTAGADVSYRSKTYPVVSSSEVLAQDKYALVDAFVRWSDKDDHYYVQAGVKNLTDKRYREQGFDLSDSLGYQLAYYGAPRTFRVTLGTRF
ncbi:TonB-dependent receptor [Allosphingosinicella vermicomposti]|uniref:TonB-dependent receptor n=1 Tax=Allosphingosinicella vermicomposti TaxID=614671 RepID=UPI000D0EAF3D|nr:TonB-dependent receptor [Allosphingosinicella vermicomposti]